MDAGNAEAESTDDDQWMPLGVFALVDDKQTEADKLFQLAVNKAGVIRGNYSDIKSDVVKPISGSIDKQTQRAAWRVGDNTTLLFETGIYNLTKDEASVLVHNGPDQHEYWKLIRMNEPPAQEGEKKAGE